MKRRMHNALIVGLMALLAQACAWGAVSVSWTDGAGPHTVNLVLIDNPDYDGNPLSTEMHKVWAPEGSWCLGYQNFYIEPLLVDMPTVNPMAFTVTGNFMGFDNDGLLVNFYQVKLQENVTNHTPYWWTDFHLEMLGVSGARPRFYKVWNPNTTWRSVLKQTANRSYIDLFADAEPMIAPGGLFIDGFDAKALTDANGDGTFTFEKYPTYIIPEASSAAAILGGMAGLLTFMRRRRH